MNLAFSASDAYVPANRWIASLSDGRTVFQDVTPHVTSAWRRLQQFVNQEGVTLTGLRLQAFGQDVTMLPWHKVDGYWQVSRQQAAVGSEKNIQVLSRGVGYIKDGMIYITWITQDGVVEHEQRTHDTTKDLAGILHEPD